MASVDPATQDKIEYVGLAPSPHSLANPFVHRFATTPAPPPTRVTSHIEEPYGSEAVGEKHSRSIDEALRCVSLTRARAELMVREGRNFIHVIHGAGEVLRGSVNETVDKLGDE